MKFTVKAHLIPQKKLIICQVCKAHIKLPGLEISSLEDTHTHTYIAKVVSRYHVRRDIIFYYTYSISWIKL